MVKKVGRYELKETIASDDKSKTKRAIDTEGKLWTIRIVSKDIGETEELRRDIAILKVLRCEYVLFLQEVLLTDKHLYLVFEHVTGVPLFDKIVDSKFFPEPVGRRYFQQFIIGLWYCHQRGIAHRNLNPENLLLDPNDTVKIANFGMAGLQSGGPKGDGTLLNTVCGIPNYVAPEVLSESGYNGFMADVWSAGVILFVMCAGYLPFEDPNLNTLFNKIERGDFRMSKHFSAPLQELVRGMIVVDTTKRLTVEQIMQHPWFVEDLDPEIIQKAKMVGPLSVSKQEVKDAVTQAQETKQ
eukprot:PhF_6_TR4353/c0_g1_i1/m.5868